MRCGVMVLAALLSLVLIAQDSCGQGAAEVATGFAAGNHFVVSGSGDLWTFSQTAEPSAQWLGRATLGPPASPVVGAFYAMTTAGHRFFAVLRNGDVHAFGDRWVFDSARLIGNVFSGAPGKSIATAFYGQSYGYGYAVAQDGDIWRWQIESPGFDPQYAGNIFGAIPTATEPTTWGRVKDAYHD